MGVHIVADAKTEQTQTLNAALPHIVQNLVDISFAHCGQAISHKNQQLGPFGVAVKLFQGGAHGIVDVRAARCPQGFDKFHAALAARCIGLDEARFHEPFLTGKGDNVKAVIVA